MKGKWIIDLFARLLDRTIKPGEALRFALARVRPKPVSFSLAGIRFENAEHVLWSAAAGIILGNEYTRPGFEIQSGSVVVDIGAHKGTFTALAVMRGAKQVIAYEPISENFTALSSLISRHQWHNVELHNKALAGESGQIQIFRGTASSRHTLTGIDPLSGQELNETFNVPAISLSDALSELPRVDFLKMDCEGAEFPIFFQATPEAISKIHRLVLEYHATPQSPELTKLIQTLSNHFADITVKHKQGVNLGYIFAT